MPRTRTTRQPSGPGHATRRPRLPRVTLADVAPTPRPGGARRAPRARRGNVLGELTITRRALILLGVVAILIVSYANSTRIMLGQQRDLAAMTAQINAQKAQIGGLDAQLERWKDPAYVKSQARTQLGWVMPGETGYRVIGADGKMLKASETKPAPTTAPANATRWWDRLAGSVQAADAQG